MVVDDKFGTHENEREFVVATIIAESGRKKYGVSVHPNPLKPNRGEPVVDYRTFTKCDLPPCIRFHAAIDQRSNMVWRCENYAKLRSDGSDPLCALQMLCYHTLRAGLFMDLAEMVTGIGIDENFAKLMEHYNVSYGAKVSAGANTAVMRLYAAQCQASLFGPVNQQQITFKLPPRAIMPTISDSSLVATYWQVLAQEFCSSYRRDGMENMHPDDAQGVANVLKKLFSKSRMIGQGSITIEDALKIL